jgi:hypothetical protein
MKTNSLPNIDEAGTIACKMSEHLKPSDQAMFIAGFQECIKYLKPKKYKVWDCKIVIDGNSKLPDGFDAVPRMAAQRAIEQAGF